MSIDIGDMREVVGVIPAAGTAERISPLPCSKEIFPVGFYESADTSGPRPKAAAQYLLDQMRIAGAEKAFVVIRKGKWDIPAYFSGDDCKCLPLAFVSLEASRGAPFTVDRAYPFIKDDLVLFGFPDILSTPGDCFCQMIAARQASGADIVLGLYPADRPQKMDMVELDAAGRIRKIHIKPRKTELEFTWISAVWTPRFAAFMHAWIGEEGTAETGKVQRADGFSSTEVYMGDVIQAAIDAHLAVDTVIFPAGRYIDIGTSEDLARAVRTWRELEPGP